MKFKKKKINRIKEKNHFSRKRVNNRVIYIQESGALIAP